MNNQNLKPQPFEKGSERAREAGRKGGVASGIAKRKRREMRETLEMMLSMPLNKGTYKDLEKLKNFAQLKDANVTAQDAIIYALMLTAINGGKDGVAAFKEIQNTLMQGNDVATLNTEVLNGLSKEEIMKLADIDEELVDEDGGTYDYEDE